MKSTDIVKPYALETAFADGVYTLSGTDDFEIPAGTSTQPTDSCVIDDGFLPITSTDLDDGGQAPERKNFNGLFYLSTDQRVYLQNGGFITFEAAVSSKIGGYPQGAVLDYVNNGIYYKVESLIDDNTNNFVTTPSLIDGTHWRFLDYGSFDGANKYLSNLNTDGNNRLHALKGYEDAGELLTDAEGLYDVIKYAHSTFDENKFVKSGSGITYTDGVASGFNGSGDLLTNYYFNPSTTWKIKCAFTTPASLSSCTIFTTTTTYGNRLQIIDGYLELRLSSNNASYDIADAVGATQLSASTKYYVELIFDGSKYEVKLSTDNQTWITDISVNSSTAIYTVSTTQIRLGKAADIYEVFTGSIDLKEFYIVESGAITFRGNQTGTDTYTINGSTVSIPYTLSKTGSKVVDSAYRSQVSAVYQAFGYAPYYTLNEGTNFTLPQGEVYGMMTNIVERYQNGDSWYRIWADGWCEQGGAHTGTTGSEQTINLLKNYKDTKYFVTYNNEGAEATYIVIKNKSTSSFGIRCFTTEGNHDGTQRWYACGYLR